MPSKKKIRVIKKVVNGRRTGQNFIKNIFEKPKERRNQRRVVYGVKRGFLFFFPSAFSFAFLVGRIFSDVFRKYRIGWVEEDVVEESEWKN